MKHILEAKCLVESYAIVGGQRSAVTTELFEESVVGLHFVSAKPALFQSETQANIYNEYLYASLNKLFI